MVIQGQHISTDEIAFICGLMAEHLDWGRTRLSEELCRRWNWRNVRGRMKDMAARTLLKTIGEACLAVAKESLSQTIH